MGKYERGALRGCREDPLSPLRGPLREPLRDPKASPLFLLPLNLSPNAASLGALRLAQALTLQSLFFFFDFLTFCFFRFPIFLAFFVRIFPFSSRILGVPCIFPSFSRDFRGSAKGDPLLLSGFPFFLRRSKGWRVRRGPEKRRMR